MAGTIEPRRPGAIMGVQGTRASEGQASALRRWLGTAALYAGMTAAILLLLAALTGVTFATLRYVSERSYRMLWEMDNVRPCIAPR